jgi:hypothetical protein
MRTPTKGEYRRLAAYLDSLVTTQQAQRAEHFCREAHDLSMRNYWRNHRTDYWMSPLELLHIEKEIHRTKMYLARWNYSQLSSVDISTTASAARAFRSWTP